MAKYRKKPIVIEAEQWFPGAEIDGVYNGKSVSGMIDMGFIFTPEGEMSAYSGDWIITNIIMGELYVCKQDVFEKTYERVEKDD